MNSTFYAGFVAAFLIWAPAGLRGSVPVAGFTADVPYLGPERAEKLDLYLPATRSPRALSPAVVWIHGGGWTGGEKGEARARQICGTLAKAGYVAVSINYKLGEGAWPMNLHDCKNAVRFLRANAAKYQLDPQRIAVAGGSAGGHLALMVGFTAGLSAFEPSERDTPYAGVSSAVRAVIDLYGPSNMLTRHAVDKSGQPTGELSDERGPVKVFGASRSENPKLWKMISPVSHITKESPPVLIMHGKADATVDVRQSIELAAALKAKGVTHELILLDGVGHTFDWEKWKSKPLPQAVGPIALSFLEKHLGPAK